MKQGAIEQRAAKISLVNGFSAIISIALQLLAVPICLKYWGREVYGSWLALYAAFMLVRSLDVGFVSYVGNKLNYLYHQDKHVLKDHLASSLTGIAVIAVLQLMIVVTAVYSDGIAFLLGIATQHVTGDHSNLALLVLIGSWALSGSYMGIVQRLLIPAGFMYQASWWAMGLQVSQFMGLIVAAMLVLDIFQTSLLFALIQMAIYTSSAIYIRQKLPAYYPWWRDGQPRIGLKDLYRSLLLTVSTIIQQGTTNGTVMLLSALTGPATVPVFTTVRTLANLWTNVTSVLTSPLLPEIVRYHATGEARKVVTVCEVYWVLVGSIVNLGVLIAYPFIKPLYGYWTAHRVALDMPLLCLLLASVVVANAGGLITLYLNGINSLRAVLAASAGRGLLCLGGGSVLYVYFGLAGFGMAILCGEILALLVLTYYFIRRELLVYGAGISLRSSLPIIVSTFSVLMFLMTESFSFFFVKYVYILALLGVASAALWGWRGLEHDVRTRLVRLVGDRLSGNGLK
jgi:O-antigen/teichoic acid export membrane protein